MNQPTVTTAKRLHKTLPLIVAGLMGLSAAVHAADYYTWVDENGVTNYSQRGPDNAQAQRMTKTTPPAQQAAVESGRPKPIPEPVSTEVDPDEAIAEERAAISAKIAEQKASNCAIGKRNLTNLEMYERISVKGDDGEERLLDADEKAARIATARQTIRENCTT